MGEGWALPGGRPMGREMACLALRDRGKHRGSISSDSPETRGEEGSQGTGWMKGRGLRTRIVARFFADTTTKLLEEK